MRTFTAVIERDSEAEFYVGHVPGVPGAHSQGKTLDELRERLREVLELLLEDNEPESITGFVGVLQITVDV